MCPPPTKLLAAFSTNLFSLQKNLLFDLVAYQQGKSDKCSIFLTISTWHL